MEFTMEKRDKQLYAASVIGDVESLNELLKEDKFVLDNYGTSTELCFKETPLHIAASQGHVEFAKVLLQNKPGLINELDSRLRSPLHLASANGRKEMVKLLLSVDSDACLMEDEFGRTPLHLAATAKGKVEVVNELVTARPEAIEQLGEVNHKFLNYQDGEGNTILHKVVALKQLETLEYLVRRKELIVDLKNRNNFTVFDIIKQMPVDSDTEKMHKLLKLARNAKTGSQENNTSNMTSWVETKKNALLVCATVIASMSYQASINPPGGVWDQNHENYTTFEGENVNVTAGTSIMATNYPTQYDIFCGFNTASFLGTLALVLLLTGSTPQCLYRIYSYIFGRMGVHIMTQKLYMRLLTFFTWITAAALSISYIFGITGTMPSGHLNIGILQMTEYSFVLWIVFIVIIVLVVVGRILYFIIKHSVSYK